MSDQLNAAILQRRSSMTVGYHHKDGRPDSGAGLGADQDGVLASEPAPTCGECGATLAHFAGPALGERGLVCQTPGCSLSDVDMEDEGPF